MSKYFHVLILAFALLLTGPPVLKKSYVLPSLTATISQDHGLGASEVDSLEPVESGPSCFELGPSLISVRIVESAFVTVVLNLALQLLQSLVISLPPPA